MMKRKIYDPNIRPNSAGTENPKPTIVTTGLSINSLGAVREFTMVRTGIESCSDQKELPFRSSGRSSASNRNGSTPGWPSTTR